VYRSGDGPNPESVKEFTDRIKAKYPDAKVVNSSDALPATEDARFIQITTLTPSSKEELAGSQDAWEGDIKDGGGAPPPRMQRYRAFNNVDVFAYTRVDKEQQQAASKDSNEYRNLWVIKTFLVTSEPLPGLRRRVEVKERKEVRLSPIENAVASIRAKNKDLEELILNMQFDTQLGKKTETNQLSMILAGVIDAAVQGGINKYREAFFDSSYLRQHPDHEVHIESFKEALREQIKQLDAGLKVFGEKLDQSLVPLYRHLGQRFQTMMQNLGPLLGQTGAR
jgi:hypothetical protein